MGAFSDPALILPGAITNTEIAAGAAIAKTKLASLDIVNADVNVAAAIAISKLASFRGSGNYIGDNTTNKAIPHSLGYVPKMVLILSTTGSIGIMIINVIAGILYQIDYGATAQYDVTDPDGTNFYVGAAGNPSGAGNANPYVYHWFAV